MKFFSRRRRTLSALAAVSVAMAGTAALVHDGAVVAAAAPAMKPAITIDNYSFKPGTITVKRGTTVVWINKDDDVHTIKGTDGPEAFNSPALEAGSRFGYAFHHAGTYHYICTVHPYMHGVIVVR
jgi:plastocyanin